MICPRWVAVKAQPIAVEDVVAYLMAAMVLPVEQCGVFEIGGTDQVSYGQIMQEYARQCGLRRWMIPVPILTPRLSSLWLGLITPVYARIGRKLIDSMRNPTLVHDTSALTAFGIKPRGLREAIERALRHEDQEFALTSWCDALSSAGKPQSWGGVKFGTRLVDSRTVQVSVPPASAFAPIQRIGGLNGWYFANVLWWFRGLLDLVVGGVGLRRGRRDPHTLSAGDALDFWRVETFVPDHELGLVAEMTFSLPRENEDTFNSFNACEKGRPDFLFRRKPSRPQPLFDFRCTLALTRRPAFQSMGHPKTHRYFTKQTGAPNPYCPIAQQVI
jgi:hypothetical protein